MKKVLLGFLIAGVVLIGGCAAAGALFVGAVDSAITEVENTQANKDQEYAEMAGNIEWKIENSNFLTMATGILENTTEEVIDYIQFECKIFDSDGVVIDTSFANATDIQPGEKRKIEILILDENFEKFEVKVSSSVF